MKILTKQKEEPDVVKLCIRPLLKSQEAKESFEFGLILAKLLREFPFSIFIEIKDIKDGEVIEGTPKEIISQLRTKAVTTCKLKR